MALIRVELVGFCKQNILKPKYMISKIAEKYNVKILFLPVAHPELNPIELVWSMLKKYIKEKNVNYSLSEVEKHAHEFFTTYKQSTWQKCVEHVKKIENEYLEIADDLPFSM